MRNKEGWKYRVYNTTVRYNLTQKKTTDELGVKLLDEKKRTTTLEKRLDELEKKKKLNK